MPPTVAELLDSASHAGGLQGAHAIGEASGGERLLIRIGLWFAGERVARARFRATTCASLIAYAEAACRHLEDGAAPPAVDAEVLGRSVRGVHPTHRDRASLVVTAIARAVPRSSRGSTP